MILGLAISVPSSAHFIYIPVALLVGVVLGFILGSRAARDAYALELRKAEERAARKAAREAAKLGGGDKPPAV